MTKKENLEIGDVIYQFSYGKIIGRHKIDRVTKTKAVAGNTEFKISARWIRPFTQQKFSSSSYEIETPENALQYQQQNLVNRISNVKWSDIPLETLLSINHLLTIKP